MFLFVENTFSSDTISLFKKANSFFEHNDYANAERLSREIIKINNKFFYAYNLLGEIYYQKGKFDDALFYFKKSIDIYPSQPQIYNIIGVIYNKLSQFDEALTYYERGLKYDDDNFELNYNLGIVYLINKRDPYKAIEHFDKAQKIQPMNSKLLYINGISHLIVGKPEMTLDAITKLRANDNEYLASQLEEAIRQYSQNRNVDLNEAVENYVATQKNNDTLANTEDNTTTKRKIEVGPSKVEIKGRGTITIKQQYQPKK